MYRRDTMLCVYLIVSKKTKKIQSKDVAKQHPYFYK